MNTNLKEKLDAISQDTEYLKELFEQDTPEKIQAKFAERGIELTIDEVKDIVVRVVDTVDSNAGAELDEESLQNVSGGFAASAAIGFTLVAVFGIAGAFAGWRSARGKC